MMLSLTRALRIAAAGLIFSVLTACGGGTPNEPTAVAAGVAIATPAAATPVGQKFIQSTALNADGPATTLVVRAHGMLAGGVGPIIRVLVDGVEVGTTEVRAATPQDHRFEVAAMQPGTKVDVVYVNDASVGGVDRNLFISQVTAGSTYVLPDAPGVTIDGGTGAAAFDGLNTVPGRSAMYINGALRMTWPDANMPERLTVRASGTLADNIGPVMQVRVDGVVAGSTEVRSAVAADYTFAVPALQPGSRVDVVYTNDEVINGADRNLTVAYLMAGTTVLLPNASGVTYDMGTGQAAFDGASVLPGQASMAANGALRGRWPTPNMTEALTVRASGQLAGNVGPFMQVQVNGVVLGTLEVRAPTATDHRFAGLPMKPGDQVDVLFINPGSAAGETRSLTLAYAMAGKTYVKANNNSLQTVWPAPNLTDTLTVRAKGVLAGGVGPVMQVQVDGLVVGSTEVRASDFIDYSFAVPAMQPGHSVDVLHTNDTTVNGVERNLDLAYLVAGKTFMRPTATGAGPVKPALNLRWPQPNITDTVTVRASGTLAGNVGPVMRLWVDGVAVSSVEVRASTPTDYTLAVPTLKPGSKIGVTFDNPETVAGVQRQLSLAYLIGGGTVLTPGAAGSTYNAGSLQATWPSQNLTDTLTVRAHGAIAGDVGPIMQVLVDRVLVGSAEIRATLPTDYRFAVPAMRPGTKVDVVYTNDASVGGVDRNLFITQLLAGKTYALPTAADAVIDRGTGAAATDGLDVAPGQSAMYISSALRLTWPAPNLTEQLTLRASASLLDGTGPIMAVRVDGVTVASMELRATEPTDFVLDVPALTAGSRVDVAHTNYTNSGGSQRTLNLHYLRSGTALLLPSAAGSYFDLGTGLAAFDGANLQPGQTALNANGALRGRWPAPNMTDTLTVRASGNAAGGIAPRMQVLVDGVVLGSADVATSEPADFRFPTMPLAAGRRLDVLFTNPGTSGADTRSLNAAYAIDGKSYMLGSAGTVRGAWPAPNLTDTITVRAKGSLAGNVGPLMQLLINGVVMGSTEVRSTDFSDYSFAVPSMVPGAKVDVVFTNDAVINGDDRNLRVAYLIAGNTSVLPNSPGATYDLGNGAAAFDGAMTKPGQGLLFGSGALRLTWPAPNITSTVTVRASSTFADSIGPVMQLRVDGVSVSQVEVRATTPTDYILAVPKLKAGSKIEVVTLPPATGNSIQPNLKLDYLIAESTVLLSTAAGAVVSNNAWGAAWPEANLTDSVTVRASGTLAGDVGPVVQLHVDGVVVGSVEVRSNTLSDYRFAVPRLKAGSKLDLVYTNDGTVGGVDRNLYVAYLITRDTLVLPSASGAVYDRGANNAALDGIDLLPGQASMAWGGALRVTWPAPNLTERLTVRASGSLAGATGPVISLRVDGVIVGSTEVRSAEPADHVFAVPPLKPGSQVDVAYTNDEIVDGVDRNLTVAYMSTADTVLPSTASEVSIDLGKGLAAFDGVNTLPGQALMTQNGALRAKWPIPNRSDTITVRASARMAGNVGPVMQVRVNGIVLQSIEVRSTTPADYSFTSLPILPGSRVDVDFINPGSAGSETRSLNVVYAITGDTYLLATSGAMHALWPAPNRTNSITVRAKGSLVGNVGPLMQLLVNGVVLGSAEVRSKDFSDYTFAVPVMAPGAKVDVVFANDAVLNGEDRNLRVAYLVSGNTSVLPDAPGAIYDLGAGVAAFDGAMTQPGQSLLFSNGALRLTWPAPNITSTVTVRASGTLAGNVGPVLQLRVDGIAVSQVEVRATTPTDYILSVPALKPGSKIDAVYTNDAVVGGVDRNLNIDYLMAGGTAVQSGSSAVRYDLGSGNAAFDDADVLPGQSVMGLNGALRFSWPMPNLIDTLIVRASATLAGSVGALMQLRVNGVIMGTVEVRSTTGADHVFSVPRLIAGSKVDVAFINDATIDGQDRNLFVQYIRTQGMSIVPTGPNVQLDTGAGEAAFDGAVTAPGVGNLAGNSALRFTMPAPVAAESTLQAQFAASRFLQQATFGPKQAEVIRLTTMPLGAWLTEQMSMPATPDYVNHIQAKYNLGSDYRPLGSQFTASWVGERFWATAANSPDQLRKRVGFALHQIFMVSQADSDMHYNSRAYASYMDTLNKHAFGNFRSLLEEVALSPAMGIYLSHMRNRKEDPITGRLPDENFAREVMQLFSIGLYELNADGTPKLSSQGVPIETYTNDDVMALAKVFTGWSWAFPDNQLTEQTFRWGKPDYSAGSDLRIDLQRMKAYPGQHSQSEKRLFIGKPHAVVIPANSEAQDSLRLALDALFQHPNVGPFIGRQLIQRLVTSHPSGPYVARVAAVFNNNGAGVRGDLAAVVRAVLLDGEARTPPADSVGKLREPVLRVAHWIRSFAATSATGEFKMAFELHNQSQRALNAGSVFGYFRPGFVPPNTAFAPNSITVPELQIVNESTTALWVNTAMGMAGAGIGWTGTANDVSSTLAPLVAMAAAGNVDGLIGHLNLLLYAGRMSATLRQDILDAVTSVPGNTTTSNLNRARVALFLAMASPEYLVQH